MATARAIVVEEGVPGWYHCVSRVVRRAHLLLDGRREWLEHRIDRLQGAFAIRDAAHAIMDNHMHLVAHLQPHLAETWSAEEVVRRWSLVYPRSVMVWGGVRVRRGEPLPADVPDDVIAAVARNQSIVEDLRRRLASLSWFMKALKEPLARRANREDGVTGYFWEGRFKCRRILDVPGLIACMIYVDLNPIRAGIVDSLAASAFTSIRRRLGARCVPAFARHANACPCSRSACGYLGMPEADRKSRIADIETTSLAILKEAESQPSSYAAAVTYAKRKIAEHARATQVAG